MRKPDLNHFRKDIEGIIRNGKILIYKIIVLVEKKQ